MTTLRLLEDNFREVRAGGRRLLFHVPTAGLFEADDAAARVIDLFRERGELAQEDLASLVESGVPVEEALGELRTLGIVSAETNRREFDPDRTPIRHFPLSTLVLNVTTGCNLSCTYCYKEDLATPAGAKRMDFETARKSVDLLLSESAPRARVTLVFFGGEPLTQFPLIRQVVHYAEQRCRELDKRVDFSMTTNALLLDERHVDYLDAHRFGLTVSIDGPKAVHDRNRHTAGGAGSYDTVARNAALLVERYKSKPVGARVTVASGAPDLEPIFNHLRYELGFAEVGFAPVTAEEDSRFGLKREELAHAFGAMKRLGERYESAALRGDYIGFSNLHHLVGDLYHGTRRLLPCGAGIALLSVDHEGQLNLCHRFTGSALPAFGDVDRGIDKPALGAFLDQARDLSGRWCAQCHIRSLCSGGCYHERYRRYGDPMHPTYHYCELLREWVDFAIAAYSRISAHNPGFFEQYLEAGHYAQTRGVRS